MNIGRGEKHHAGKSVQRAPRLLQPEEYVKLRLDPALMAQHDKRIQKLLNVAYLSQDPRYLELVAKKLRRRVLKLLMQPDPFIQNLPPAGSLPPLGPGRIPIAWLSTGDIFTIGVERTSQNILLPGSTGSGKTNWLKMLLSCLAGQAIVVAFDRKGDLAEVAGIGNQAEVVVLDASQLKIALFQPPAAIRIPAFISIIVELLGRHLHLEASRRLMSDALFFLFERKREEGNWPTLSDLIELIDRIRADSVSRLGQYREAALYALKKLLRGTGGILNFRRSTMLETVFAQPRVLVVRTGDLDVEHASIVASLFIMHAYEGRRISGQREPRVVFVLDDALPMVHSSAAAESEGGPDPLATWAFMGRGYGLGLVVAVQNPSLIGPAILNNAGTVVCFGSYGADKDVMARFMGLTREQAAILPMLRPGMAVAIARSEWPLAVLGAVPEFNVGRRVSAHEIQQRADEFLSRVEALGAAERVRAEAGELGEAAARVLVKTVQEPGTVLLKVYSDLSLHPAEGKAALDELTARGYIRLHGLPRKGRGGQMVVVEALPAADRELEKRGIKRPSRVLKGGFMHDVLGRYLGRWASVRGYRHWFERTLGRKTFDFVYEEGGELVAIEIVLSGSPRWNAAQALKGLENEGICRLIIAGDTRKKLTEIGKALKNLDSFQAYGDRVEVCHLAEYVHG